jgi:manganese transport protein
VAEACRFNLVDSFVAMNGAFLVNAAILIVAAAAFHTRGQAVTDLRDAHRLLENLLGSRVAPVAFAIALICAGQSSTITGTLAGQITMEGFLDIRLRPWLRRLMTRLLAIVPAVVVINAMGEGSAMPLLIFSQVVLSLQLPFAVIPLIKFTSSRRKMGPFASPAWVQALAWLVGAAIVGLNVTLLAWQFRLWLAGAGAWTTPLGVALGAACLALIGLLSWMVFRREEPGLPHPAATAQDVLASAERMNRRFGRIGAALENRPSDDRILAEAVALAKTHRAELVLMHVVEGVGGQWFGPQTGDLEARQDEVYLSNLAQQVASRHQAELPLVRYVLAYGSVTKGLVKLARKEQLDLLVMGGHGHKRLADLLHGETITGVRHGSGISMLTVR